MGCLCQQLLSFRKQQEDIGISVPSFDRLRMTQLSQRDVSGGFAVQTVGEVADFLGDVNGVGLCRFEGVQGFR
jgi:hypothetical protein